MTIRFSPSAHEPLGPANPGIDLSCIEFTMPVKPWAEPGIIREVSFVVANFIRVNGVGVKLEADGRITLRFPGEVNAHGREVPFVTTVTFKGQKLLESMLAHALSCPEGVAKGGVCGGHENPSESRRGGSVADGALRLGPEFLS